MNRGQTATTAILLTVVAATLVGFGSAVVVDSLSTSRPANVTTGQPTSTINSTSAPGDSGRL